MESEVRTILMTVKFAVNFWHFLQGPELLATVSHRSQPTYNAALHRVVWSEVVNFRVAFSLIFGVEVERGEIGVINIEKVVNGNQIHSEFQEKAVDLTT